MTDREPLTTCEQRVLDYIRQTIALRGIPPTYREICANFGYRSTNAATTHLKTLIRKGYLVSDKRKNRTMRPAEAGPDPLVALVADVRALAGALGVDIGPSGAPLPPGWLEKCIEAAQTATRPWTTCEAT